MLLLHKLNSLYFTSLTPKMASNSKLLRFPIYTITSKPSDNLKRTSLSLSFPFTTQPQHHSHLSISNPIEKSLPKLRKIPNLSPKCSLSSPNNPPTSKEEAILQAKTSLSSTLEKPLNNPKLAGKIKKLKQPRFRVEIPVIDESPSSLSQLAVEIFGNLPIKRKGLKPKILLLWANQSIRQAADKAFDSQSSNILIQNLDLSSILDEDVRILNSADVAVFLAPEDSQLEVIREVTDTFCPKPVVIFNPKWSFEEESNFGEMSGFVGSFEVVYSFMGLEVRGILSKRKGVVFKCVKDGVLSGDKWTVFVEEEDGKLRTVSRFKSRPSIAEVENVLYNLMAVNSPVTKSAKFLKNLVSNVTGKK